jgi:two-component system, NtrC family, nitrogen regulation sensor histidine kinase NtrY
MKRVMINLLDNAIDAINEEGQVEVGLSYDRERGVVEIEVADDGQGIPPEHKAQVFEPYFSTKKHGTGLGLAIVSDIIRRPQWIHQDSIARDPEEPASSSSFP